MAPTAPASKTTDGRVPLQLAIGPTAKWWLHLRVVFAGALRPLFGVRLHLFLSDTRAMFSLPVPVHDPFRLAALKSLATAHIAHAIGTFGPVGIPIRRLVSLCQGVMSQ